VTTDMGEGTGIEARARARSAGVAGSLVRYWDYAPAADVSNDGGTHDGSNATAGAAPVTILMLHGFRGDHHGLLRIVEALPGCRILVPDLPGFGQSEPLPDRAHDVAAYVEVTRALIEELGLGPETVLLGHSFGSIIASHFAARHPELIGSLVLVNPICEPALKGPKGMASKLAELYYVLGARLPESLGLALLRSRLVVRITSIMMAKTKDPVLRRWIHGQHDAYFSAFASRDVLLETYRASTTGTVRQVAPSLTMPVLLVAAEKDDLGSVAGQRRLATLIPGAELHFIPDVGHLIHYETPGQAAGLITGFLHRLQA
jgi:pimeloyl-ACP methyl ester carboxylesterase